MEIRDLIEKLERAEKNGACEVFLYNGNVVCRNNIYNRFYDKAGYQQEYTELIEVNTINNNRVGLRGG